MLSPSLRAFFKKSGQRDFAEKVFINLIPSSDTTLYILRAHLLIEDLILKLIQNALPNPNVLNSTDLNYKTKCLLLKALYGDSHPEWLYSALTSLGGLRNKCAHVLDHPKLDESVADFIKIAYDYSDENEALLHKRHGRGYSVAPDCTKSDLHWFKTNAEQQHNLRFRLPIACERIIEDLLREWHSKQA